MDTYVQGIKNLQRMGHIPETGVVDRRTLELMQKPRCGVKDITKAAPLTRHRRKRYVTAPSKWETNDLTYRYEYFTIIYNQFKCIQFT